MRWWRFPTHPTHWHRWRKCRIFGISPAPNVEIPARRRIDGQISTIGPRNYLKFPCGSSRWVRKNLNHFFGHRICANMPEKRVRYGVRLPHSPRCRAQSPAFWRRIEMRAFDCLWPEAIQQASSPRTTRSPERKYEAFPTVLRKSASRSDSKHRASMPQDRRKEVRFFTVGNRPRSVYCRNKLSIPVR